MNNLDAYFHDFPIYWGNFEKLKDVTSKECLLQFLREFRGLLYESGMDHQADQLGDMYYTVKNTKAVN